MPIVDIAAPELGSVVDTPKGFAVTPGETEINHGSDTPSFGSVIGAEFRRDNMVGGYFSSEERSSPTFKQPGFHAWDKIKDTKYEPYYDTFSNIRNDQAFANHVLQINRENEDRKTVEAAPWYQKLPAALMAGAIDLPSLIPGGAFIRGAKGGFSVAKSGLAVGAASGVSSAIQEAGLQSSQVTRTKLESAENIGASIFLGGLLGAGGAKLLSNVEWNRSVALIERELSHGVALEDRPVLSEIERILNNPQGEPLAPTLMPAPVVTDAIPGNPQLSSGAASLDAGAKDAARQAALEIERIQKAAASGEISSAESISQINDVLAKAGKFEADFKAAWQSMSGADGNALNAVGASAAGPASLEANSVYGRMAARLAGATAGLNPLLRALRSPSRAWRDISTKLFENSLYLKKNAEGIASEPAAETFMKEWNAGLSTSIRATEDGFQQYAKRGGTMKRDEFYDAVGKAMRRNDESDIPEVAKVARDWRSKVFDPLKDAAIEAKLLPKDVSPQTASSYFSRMWNKNRIAAEEPRFKQIVRGWIDTQVPRWAEDFDKETVQQSGKLDGDKLRDYLTERRIEREARFDDPQGAGNDIANQVFDTLTGKAENGVRPEYITITARGPLKERTFLIPDALVEDFLENDVREVGQRYTRVMGADVELARKFGSVDMHDQIQAIRNDYAQLRQGVTDPKELTRLEKQERSDIGDLEGVRDLLRGTRQQSPIEQNYARLVRSANSVNYLRSMGEVVLASLTDAVRPAMVHGLSAYMQTIGHLMSNMQAIKFSVEEAKLAGNITERVLGHRLATLAEIGDPYTARGPMEHFLENMTNIASKWNGIRIWTDGMKSIASVMTQNRILGNATDFAKIKPIEKTYLAYLGIDESMAGRIADQFAKHGQDMEGVRVANTEKWNDLVAVRAYRAAMNKDVDSIIVQPSRGDLPLFSSTPTGKAMLQFKSFALASNQRILLRGLQEDQTRFVGGTVAMTAMGMLMTYLKAISGNREEKLQDLEKNPGWWIAEGFDRAGIVAVPVELANAFEKATGVNPIKTPMKMFDEGSAISQKNQNRSLLGSLVGPSAGLVDDLTTTAGVPARIVKGEDVSQAQKNAAERLMPFNSYAGVRQMLRYVVNPQNP